MKRRGELVREFRALVDGKSRDSWGAVISRACEQVGTVSPDDSHSILVSLAKGLKQNLSGKRAVHPVRAAPLALDLLKNIFESSETPFRTKAGAFGFVSRLGIDWSAHLPSRSRDQLMEALRARFAKSCETSLDSSLDPQTVGYSCEAAVFFALHAPEFTDIVSENIKNRGWSFPPLAIVQVSRNLAEVGFADPAVWEVLIERTVMSLPNFTPQNLSSFLKAVPGETINNDSLERIYEHLSTQTGMMRLLDCISILESVARFRVNSEAMIDLVFAIQRRAKLLIITSPSRLAISDFSRITCALSSLQLQLSSRIKEGQTFIQPSFSNPKLLGVSL